MRLSAEERTCTEVSRYRAYGPVNRCSTRRDAETAEESRVTRPTAGRNECRQPANMRENEILRLALPNEQQGECRKAVLSLPRQGASDQHFNKMVADPARDAIIKGLKQGYITLEDISEGAEDEPK